MITVFTPTYNRAYILPKLYESLCNQTCKDFEWLVVDDGSTDETFLLLEKWKAERKINVNYQFKQNGGLNSAYNFAVSMTNNEIFFRVDSDDSIKKNAIEEIKSNWHLVKDNENLCGLVFLSVYKDGKIVGKHPFNKNTESNFFEYRNKFGAIGDRAEVIKTAVLKKYPFPKFGNEEFCPEGLMWNRIAKNYNAIYLNIPIYEREYIADSITTNVVATLKKNAIGATAYYSELLNMRPRFSYFIKNSLLFWRYAFFNKKKFIENLRMIPVFSWFFIIPAFGILIIDKIRGR